MTGVGRTKRKKREFQLTHPWGCDGYISLSAVKSHISTHTPVRVWRTVYIKSLDDADFNSHTREGVTIPLVNGFQTLRFQLTHPWGCDEKVSRYITKYISISTHTPVRVWHRPTPPCRHSNDFNSHTREGVTLFLSTGLNVKIISTHTPVRVWHNHTHNF